MNLVYDDIVARRRALKIEGFKSLSDVDFDGPWVCPAQIISNSLTGPVLVGLHWLDELGIEQNREILRQLGYLPSMPFNRVVDAALAQAGLYRSDIYITQAFHLVPSTRSGAPRVRDIDASFDQVTKHELIERRVIALGTAAAAACGRHGIPHISVPHPSARVGDIEKVDALASALSIGHMSQSGATSSQGQGVFASVSDKERFRAAVLKIIKDEGPTTVPTICSRLNLKDKFVRNAIDWHRGRHEPIWYDSMRGFWWSGEFSLSLDSHTRWKRSYSR